MGSEVVPRGALLYRGVSTEMHSSGTGLRARNQQVPFRRDVSYNSAWRHDCAVTYGDPVSQAVHAHQRDSEAFNGPGLSFSRSEVVARHFATTGGLCPGVVYIVSADLVIDAGCRVFDPAAHTRAPENPEEGEIIVVMPPGEHFPEAAVVCITEVG